MPNLDDHRTDPAAVDSPLRLEQIQAGLAHHAVVAAVLDVPCTRVRVMRVVRAAGAGWTGTSYENAPVSAYGLALIAAAGEHGELHHLQAAGLLTERSSRTPRCSPNSPAWSPAPPSTSWRSRPGSPPPSPKPLARSPRSSPASVRSAAFARPAPNRAGPYAPLSPRAPDTGGQPCKGPGGLGPEMPGTPVMSGGLGGCFPGRRVPGGDR